MPVPVYDRVMRHVVEADGCLLWSGKRNALGYGLIRKDGRGKYLLVHRVVYEHDVGPIPAGMEMGHNCPGEPKPNCVRHVRPVTKAQNQNDRYGGRCARGLHDMAIDGVVWGGKQRCRPCKNANARRWHREGPLPDGKWLRR